MNCSPNRRPTGPLHPLARRAPLLLLLVASCWLSACGPRGPASEVLAESRGTMVGDQLGTDLAAAGDLDGDGRPDLLAGASQFLTEAAQPGYVQVLSGDGRLLDTLRGTSGADGFGAAVVSVGDADGDGVRDIAVGAPFADEGRPDAGSIHMFSGRTGSPLWTVHGPAGGDGLGVALAPLGDVDGDDLPDLAAAALQRAVGPGHDPGLGYVVALSGASGQALFTVPGSAESVDFGRELAPLGDVDGDGLPDLAASAPGSQAVLYISGRNGAVLRRIEDLGAGFGSALATASDRDGDGLPELIVGAPLDSHLKPLAGAVHVLSGADGSTLLVARGDVEGLRLGSAVASLMDLDGDGVSELAAAPAGGGAIRILSGADGHELRRLEPEADQFDFGAALVSLGDSSGTDALRLGVGFPGVGPMANSAGGVQIVALRR
jgi:hypothetical protein